MPSMVRLEEKQCAKQGRLLRHWGTIGPGKDKAWDTARKAERREPGEEALEAGPLMCP